MLSRISSFGSSSICRSKIIFSISNKINNNNIVINKNQFNQLLNNSNNNNNNNNNVFGINKKYYSTSPPPTNNESPKPPNISSMRFLNAPFFKNYSKDQGTLSFSNIFLLVFGLGFIYLSVPSLIMYFMYKDKPANDVNLFTIMNYFNLYPPYRIFDKEGYIKRIVDSYKNGECSKEGRRILEMMTLYPSVDEVNYLEKYGFYDDVFEKVLAKKTKLTRDDPEAYLLNLMLISGKVIPHDVLKKTEQYDENLPGADEDKFKKMYYLLPKVRHLFDITKTDIIASTVIAAPIAAFLTFRYRIPMVYVFKSMKRSTLVTAALISAPALNQAFQRFSINKSEGIGSHVVKTRIATIAYGSLLVYCSTLPFISVVSPIAFTLLIEKSLALIWLAIQYQTLELDSILHDKDSKLIKENNEFNNDNNNHQKVDK